MDWGGRGSALRQGLSFGLGFSVAWKRTFESQLVGCGPTGLHHLFRCGIGYGFLLGQPLPQALPRQRLKSSLSAQDGVSAKSISPLTSQLAQEDLSGSFKASELRREPVISALANFRLK